MVAETDNLHVTIGLHIQSSFLRWMAQMPRKPWVARIVGRDPKYELARSFLDSKVDYSESDKKGRGIKHWFYKPAAYLAAGWTEHGSKLTKLGPVTTVRWEREAR